MLVITIQIPAFAGMTVKLGDGGCNNFDRSVRYKNPVHKLARASALRFCGRGI